MWHAWWQMSVVAHATWRHNTCRRQRQQSLHPWWQGSQVYQLLLETALSSATTIDAAAKAHTFSSCYCGSTVASPPERPWPGQLRGMLVPPAALGMLSIERTVVAVSLTLDHNRWGCMVK